MVTVIHPNEPESKWGIWGKRHPEILKYVIGGLHTNQFHTGNISFFPGEFEHFPRHHPVKVEGRTGSGWDEERWGALVGPHCLYFFP